VRILNRLASALPAVLAAIVLGLSVQLIRTKQANASLAAEVASGIHHFVSGADLPDLSVQEEAGPRSLRDTCGERGTVIYISAASCPFCAKIAPEVNALAGSRNDLLIANVVVEGTREDGLPAPVRVATAAPAAVANGLHVRVVPAIVAVDSACRIQAAGAGYNASRAVLRFLGRSRT